MAQYTIDNQPGTIDFEIGESKIARTVQNAKNLLMTKMGEVPYDRLRGFDHALFHLPMSQMRMALMPELDRVMLWEPDIEVVEAEAYLNDAGETVITVTIDVGINE